MSSPSVTRVLFICMGNICRSPLAEALFQHRSRERSLDHHYELDSAGIGDWHAGDLADHRSRAVAERNGVALVTRSRQVRASDFVDFDLVIAMDQENVRDLLDRGCPESKIRSLMDYHPGSEYDHVPDPYYGGDDGFDLVFSLVDDAVGGFLDQHHPDDA